MTSENQALTNLKITKGPGRIEILEALFFKRESILVFNLGGKFDGKSQLLVKLLGVIPLGVEQSKVLIVEYIKNHHSSHPGVRTRAVMVYDDYNRTGRFTQSNTVDELVGESWY